MNHRRIAYNNAIYTMHKGVHKPLSPRTRKMLEVIKSMAPAEFSDVTAKLRSIGIPPHKGYFDTLIGKGLIERKGEIVSVK